MLTPRFSLTQDDECITAKIDAPYVKFSEVEMWLEGSEFSFYCKPYHLRLYFSGQIVEDGTESAQYDVDSGVFTIRIPKESKGEMFDNLDMLTRLITPTSNKKPVRAAAIIEVLDSSPTVDNALEEEIDWSVEQVLPCSDPDPLKISHSDASYGFNLKDTQIFTKLQEECHELLDIKDPDDIPLTKRSLLQEEEELKNFNAEYYLADSEDDSTIQEFVTYKSLIETIYDRHIQGICNNSILYLTLQYQVI